MRNPNRRYGNQNELQHYAMGRPHAELCSCLRRSERTVRDWMAGRTRIPWWVPEILRLMQLEHQLRLQQMFAVRIVPPLSVVGGKVSPMRAVVPPPIAPAAPATPAAFDQTQDVA